MISKLLEYRIFACGTFRTNKKFYPKNLMKKDNKYASGDIEYAQCNDISVMRWKDRDSKPVTLISNMHNAAEHCVVLRRNSKGEKVPVSCPTGISDYNKYMGGVDKFDQYMATYKNLVDGGSNYFIILLILQLSILIYCTKRVVIKQKKNMFHSWSIDQCLQIP